MIRKQVSRYGRRTIAFASSVGALTALTTLAAFSLGCLVNSFTTQAGDGYIEITYHQGGVDGSIRMSTTPFAAPGFTTANDEAQSTAIDLASSECSSVGQATAKTYNCKISGLTNYTRYYFKYPQAAGDRTDNRVSDMPGPVPSDVRASTAYDSATKKYTVTILGDALDPEDDKPNFVFEQDGLKQDSSSPEFVTTSSATVLVTVKNLRGPNPEGIKLTVALNDSAAPTPTATPLPPTATPTPTPVPPTPTPTFTPTPGGSCGPAPAGVMCFGNGDCASCSCDTGPTNPNFPQGTCN